MRIIASVSKQNDEQLVRDYTDPIHIVRDYTDHTYVVKDYTDHTYVVRDLFHFVKI